MRRPYIVRYIGCMPFDLKKIREEIEASPLPSPVPPDAAAAIVADCFRMAGKPPPADAAWAAWSSEPRSAWGEQIGVLAHFLATTRLRENTVEALRRAGDRRKALPDFIDRVAPLSAEMIRANAFRQEEFLRAWAAWCLAPIEGETAPESERRLDRLDYRKTLKEYRTAEEARKKEDVARAKTLKEAEERAAAARGWRE